MKNKKPDTVKITLGNLGDNGFHLFVTVGINGRKCRFLIDTGASKSVIDKSYFEKNIAKNLKSIKKETAGLHSSVSESHTGKIREIQIGKQKVKNHIIPALDLSHVNGTYKKLKQKSIQGILGSDLMLEYKMILDYGTMKIIMP